MTSFDRAQFLAACDVIDWQSDALRELAVGTGDSERADVSLSGLAPFMAAER